MEKHVKVQSSKFRVQSSVTLSVVSKGIASREGQKQAMDVVYVLGNGSKWRDNEIRFSLRSIERNLRNVGNVIIVGERPEFLQNVIHVQAKDIFEPGLNADGNIITKVLAACKFEGLSDNFLFINDDHLVLQDINIADVPSLHKGDMTTFKEKYWKLNFWRGRLKRTMEILKTKGYTTLHFDCHTPILFNKNKFPEVVKQFDYQDGIGYTMKSLYGNNEYAADGILLTDQKKTIFKHYTLEQIEDRLKGIQFMSFNDVGLNQSLKLWLIENFSSKSKYEKDTATDMVFDLYFWEKHGKQYEEGVEVFRKYFKHKNLLKMMEMGKTEVLQAKLNFKLNQSIKEILR